MKPSEKNQRPLSGYRILEMPSHFAGCLCGMLLADMGAEVIKVEPPEGGDPVRRQGAIFISQESVPFLSVNRNKLSLTLNLKKEEGQTIFHHLLPTADVIIEGFRPNVAREWQMDYESCRKIKENIIYLSLTPFGQTGPWASLPGNDPLVQATSGLMALTGDFGGQPLLVGNQAADFSGASIGAFAVLTALFHRERTGHGQKIDASLLDAQIYALIPRDGEVLYTGKELERYGTAHPSFAPYQGFEAQDGKRFFLSCFTQKFWSNLCPALGRPDLEKDPRFANNPDRVKNRQELIPILEDLFRQKPMAEWIKLIQKADVPCGPLNDLEMAFTDPQVVHNQMVVEMEHPRAGKQRSLANPIHFMGTPARYELPPPVLGQHSREILQELGYNPDQIRDFRAAKIV